MKTRLPRLRSDDADFPSRFESLLASESVVDARTESAVREIVDAVRGQGDAAVLEFTRRFDGIEAGSLSDLRIPAEAIEAAWTEIGDDQRMALTAAAKRIEDYHARQNQESWQYEDENGTILGQKITPLDRVGVYVPGGKASYPSSVLMNAIPAKVAGVGEIVMTVPAPAKAVNPLVLAAARIAKVDEILTIGGAQAIAALAFGTESLLAVDKITGPGNRFVATAKRLVYGAVGIDMIAGPSEIVIVGDGSAPADWMAMDLLSQAEHDEEARAILISPDRSFLDRVQDAIEDILPTLERAQIARKALEENGALIETRDIEEAIALVNRLAPEHLELAVVDAEDRLESVRHAGAIFLGSHTPEAFGDYCAGPNHVLPTARTARFSSPLGTRDFQKISSVIRCSPAGARSLAEIASILATGEGLTAHALSAELRNGNHAPARPFSPKIGSTPMR
ncbi:MAG: histidinol dehydrogenase [Ectothiorhodospiraceae bacterium AqS1]|nr:histidinol dehydrogenase [Ectothiorhodospiraceae bacterium AqS1]